MDRSEEKKMSIAARSSRDAREERAPILNDLLEWRPISSVPRDGTPVLILGPHGERGVATIRDETFDGLSVQSGGVAYVHQRRGDTAPTVYMESGAMGDLVAWMPLPPAENNASDGALPRHSPETPDEPKPPTSNLSGEAG